MANQWLLIKFADRGGGAKEPLVAVGVRHGGNVAVCLLDLDGNPSGGGAAELP